MKFRLEFSPVSHVEVEDHTINLKTMLPIQIKYLKESLSTIYQLQDFVYKSVTGENVPWSMK